MIPKNNSKYAPWLPLEKGMEVRIKTEPKASENAKLKSLCYCDVLYKNNTYAIGLNMSSYRRISANQAFGADTNDWVGNYIKYEGLQPIKTKTGSVNGHIWSPLEKSIDLLEKGQEIPF